MAIQVTLLSVRPGGAHHSALEAVAQDYLQRCGKTLPSTARVFRTEKMLMEFINDEKRASAALFWIADLGGKSLDSIAFAERIREARDNGIRRLMLAIGPADGWSDEARKSADL